ncbi:hypothetical protein [Umezawaea sp.]|uniref:hypothetical protein n=1 Tax=Umezawaea sp. TaxID=1955258 RepID=UPI002ED4F976
MLDVISAKPRGGLEALGEKMRKMVATATVAGAVFASVLAGAGTASAAQVNKRCEPSPSRSCSMASGFFSGGTIYVDIDAWLSPGAPGTYFTWTLGSCSGGAYASDPGKTWVCTLPASYYTLTATASFNAPVWELGLRW